MTFDLSPTDLNINRDHLLFTYLVWSFKGVLIAGPLQYKNNLQINLKIRILSETSILYLISHASFILIVGFICKDVYSNRQTLLEEK